MPENPPLSSKEYPESGSSWALAHAIAALATRGRSSIRKAENVDGDNLGRLGASGEVAARTFTR